MTKLFCGIDVAKFEHVASIYDPPSGEIILDSLHFDNNDKGFQSLLSHLSKLNKDNELFVGFESTSHYHQALFNYLTARKYKCYLINPYMTSKFRSISLRDVKTDDIDSKSIAQFLSFDYCNLANEEFLINELKDLAVQRHSLMTDSSRMKIKLKSYLDRVFPELESLVDIDVLAVRVILKKYPTARSISSARIDRLKNLAREASKGKYSPSKVESIKEAAKASIGIHSPSIGLSIVQCIETLELKERQIDTVNKEIKKHPTVLNSPLKPKKNLLLFNPPSRSAPYVYSTRPLRFDPVAACHSLRPKSLIEEFHPHYQNQSDNNGAKKFPYVPKIR